MISNAEEIISAAIPHPKRAKEARLEWGTQYEGYPVRVE
jgi:hypothetical protein